MQITTATDITKEAITELDIINEAITKLDETNRKTTNGKNLEELTARIAPFIKEWDIAECWLWAEWPEEKEKPSGYTKRDIGIDLAATRRSDGAYIAIQCKARKLDEYGRGQDITKAEVDSFASASSDPIYAERWIVTNGGNSLGDNALAAVPEKNPIKLINIHKDLLQQQAAPEPEACPHCAPNPDGEKRRQSRTCMQNKAVAESIRILKEHEQSNNYGLPIGQARGKIILPCGTGKTRISLQIVEQLTQPGELSIVLCPSIALVAQLRREYLQHTSANLRALAVCSDETAGYNPKNEDRTSSQDNPIGDYSNVSASEVKGKVTTDAEEIAKWIREGRNNSQLNVIFGTYQSSHRIAKALCATGTTAAVMIADEAHRTAGLRRIKKLEKRLRDFTVCHDNDRFPARYRIYQTATPRVYDTSSKKGSGNSDWVIRNMDDSSVFGVELYRKSYREAVDNGWLADYRIIALGVNDPDAYNAANSLAGIAGKTGRNAMTTTHFLKGLTLALVMGGATANPEETRNAPVKSCIAFMNTVAKSKEMTKQLQSETAREWVQKWLGENPKDNGQKAAAYKLEHLDASSKVAQRDNAKTQLAKATRENPHAIINVGIFGEGTDAPSLSAVAFLEPRKSPIDVIQAVGRAMRTAEGKEIGYIICPILIPPNVDAEEWLKTSGPEGGWQELGQILLALRAHDNRIEDQLADLIQIYIPPKPEKETTIVAIPNGQQNHIRCYTHTGAPGTVQKAIREVLEGKSQVSEVFVPLKVMEGFTPEQQKDIPEPVRIISGKKNEDGKLELRADSVERKPANPDGTPGTINFAKTRAKAGKMINNGEGILISTRKTDPQPDPDPDPKPKPDQKDPFQRMLDLTGLDQHGSAIAANLLNKSGLSRNRVLRDLNILEFSIKEAARHLQEDQLTDILDNHFLLNNLNEDKRKNQADGCTIAALMMMNAAMLHQRIANGRWLPDISDLHEVKNDVNIVRRIRREWEHIMRHDFRPILEPAVNVIESIEDTGKLTGLERALSHIAAEAERIAETYADMGADHAGPLFNKVMGNQASDGAFFTRPTAASIAARLTLDACGDLDWTNESVWRQHKTVDLACGSGTLLAAILTDMKRRAREQSASPERIGELQKLAVEETIKGLDINPISLQLAASQLTAGNTNTRYRKMGLHLMPYGPHPMNPAQVFAGTLELLGQSAIVPRQDGRMELGNDRIESQSVGIQEDNAELEDAVDAAKDARIVIMNPPFTERVRMGEKFPKAVQEALRKKADSLEEILVSEDPKLKNFVSRRVVAPLFVTLAELCMPKESGILTMLNPTIMFSTTSGKSERTALAKRFHVHTICTCHQPSQKNLSQNTNINESIVVLRRYGGDPKPPTRFINLDRFPLNEDEVADLHECLNRCAEGAIANGWGEVSYWPSERMEQGNWTPGVLRSSQLAEAANSYAQSDELIPLPKFKSLSVNLTQPQLITDFKTTEAGTPGCFPILKSRGAEGQTTINSSPDEYRIPKNADEQVPEMNGGTYPAYDKIANKAGYLLVTNGQATSTARLTATAADSKYLGIAWMPVTGLSVAEAKATAVFLNSTAGRLQIMCNGSRKLEFPMYMPAGINNIRIPDIKNDRIRQILADCWEATKDMVVPQYRDGECEVRRLWDEAVAQAMNWDANELAHLRNLLHQEPHVRGLGYGQYANEPETDPEIIEHLTDQ